MYAHLGQDTVVRTRDIVGIFDMDNTTVSKHTRQFLAVNEKAGRVCNVTYELPGAFVICKPKNGEQIVYISQISAATLRKRAGAD